MAHTEETKRKISLAKMGNQCAKGHHNKHTEETKRKISEKLKGRCGNVHKGEDNPNWKGDNVGYLQLHQWVRKNIPKPEFCECCGIKPPQHIHNVDLEYTRDPDTWLWLCIECHRGAHKMMRKKEDYIYY